MLAISELAKRTGISIGDVFKRFGKFSEFNVDKMMGEDLEFVYHLIFIGLKIGGEVSEKPLTLNYYQVASLVGFNAEIQQNVFECIAESMPQETEEKPKAETGKKLQRAS